MTDIEAKHILNKHTLLFNILEQNQEVPDASNGAIQEIFSVIKNYEPNYPMDWCCGACVFRMVSKANEKRKELNEAFKDLKPYNFPKQ